ncbi:CsgE family curli-type amyloid fiber assembly protein [uncultured Pontibacter sp.]|uniref:CsgE family curli-type amyloid fiber assembly protein n=1 Tax=uncultured Pontibacter sp. TaxID=453356 RepID=UPI002627EC0B|nr:CsgE family curli-type amyloid fiber assembly protein [uncultured Pontibacter sp.]
MKSSWVNKWRQSIAGIILCFALLLSLEAEAQEKPMPQDTTKAEQDINQKPNQFEEAIRRSADLEVDGLIVDETITKIGRDFYEVFHRQWEAPPAAKNFTILIKERPTRGNGALIQVALNDELLFEQQLQPRYDVIEETAIYVAGALYEYLARNQLQQQLEAEGQQQREVF